MGARKKLLLMFLALAGVVPANAAPMQIRFAEPADIPAAVGSVKFELYGRQFALELENNDRLLQGFPVARKAALSATQLLRGKLENNPASWVRLTVKDGRVAGAIWDGTDLYLIARHDEVARFLTNPLGAAPDETVVFRLSDTSNFLPPDFCATGTPAAVAASNNGLAQYQALVGELKLQFVNAPTDQIDISLIADSVLVQEYSGPNDDLTRTLLNTLNVVDGIYDSQLGLMISASDLRMMQAASDPFTSDDSSTLLGQLRTYRSAIPTAERRAISHLFTTRRLDGGTTLGIANLSGACDAANGVSLTSVGFGAISSNAALIMAHELGHNLGAEHDTAACGDNFLMWPEYSYRTQPAFSQCSLDAIKPFIAAHRGTCISSPAYGDVIPRVGSIPDPLRTEPFTWPVYVRSAGTVPIADAVVFLDLRYANLNNAIPTQGTCAPYNGTMRCQLGSIAAGAEARIDLDITANYSEPLSLYVGADAANDRYESNNRVAGTVNVQPLATAGISVTPSSRSANVGDIVSYTFTVTTGGARITRDASLSFFSGGYLQIVSATPTQGTCGTSYCTLGDIPSGNSVQITVLAKALQGETLSIGAQLSTTNAFLNPQQVSATLNATATYDLAIAAPGPRIVVAGSPFDIVIPVRANGTRPVVGGLFRMNSGGATIVSADVSGTPCANSLLLSALGSGCPLGTLNPGESRTVTIRAQFDSPADTNIYLTADILNDELWSNNSAIVFYRARYATDVSLSAFPNGFGSTEGDEFDVAAVLHSVGAQDAANVVATLDVPVGMRIVSATLPQGACVATGTQRIACTRPVLAAADAPEMKARLVGDAPARYAPTWTVAAANDGAPNNNTLNLDVMIYPRADVGIKPIPTLPGFVVNQPREFTAEVFTNALRPSENVVVTLPWSQGLTLESVTTAVGTCVITGTSPHCDLGTLQPNSRVLLTMRYRATTAGWGLSGYVGVDSQRDVNYDNNIARVTINTYEAGDVEARVASTTVSGTVGSTVALPRITVKTNTRSYDVVVDIPMPAFATLDTISGVSVCTGTTTVQCYLGEQQDGASVDIDVKVKLDTTGTFTSNVLAHAMNDTNAANDGASFQVKSNAVVTPPVTPPSSPPASGGGGGGGGRIEWMLLAALSALALRRVAQARSDREPPRMSAAIGDGDP